MSTNKQSYINHRISQNSPLGHVAITDGDVPHDNSTGRIFDLHGIPDREVDWDAVRNHDIETIANRIVALEEKLGLLGWNPNTNDYTIVPKTSVLPGFNTDAPTDRYVEVGQNGAVTLSNIGESLQYIQKGTTHDEAISLLDRAIYELALRVGAGIPEPLTPGAAGDPFDNTYKVDDIVQGKTPSDSITLPFQYNKNDALTEALAKIDHFVSQLQKEWVEPHASNGYNDPADWTSGQVHSDKFWSSQFAQAQIQRLIEDIGMVGSAVDGNPLNSTFDYSGFDPEEIAVPHTDQKKYKVWSAGRSAYNANALWKKIRDALKRLADLISKLGGGSNGISPFPGQGRALYSSSFELSLQTETEGSIVNVDLMKLINPNITNELRNKQIIILDISKKKFKVGYWAKLVWALASKAVTQDIVDVTLASTGVDLSSWKTVCDTSPHTSVYGMSWSDFKKTYMLNGKGDPVTVGYDPDDEFIPANWDTATLGTLGSGGLLYRQGPADYNYWTHSGSTFGTSGIALNGYGPNTNDSELVVRAKGGVASLTGEQLKHLPDKAVRLGGIYAWNPDIFTWTHYSQQGSNNGNDKVGTTYIPSGVMEYASNVYIAGYSKPLVISQNAFQVLFAIDKVEGEDLSTFVYSKQEIEDYLLDGTPLPVKTVPVFFDNKFSGETQQLITLQVGT